MTEVAKIRIGRVIIPTRRRPPGCRIDIFPTENGVISPGVMEICEMSGNASRPWEDLTVYQRVA